MAVTSSSNEKEGGREGGREGGEEEKHVLAQVLAVLYRAAPLLRDGRHVQLKVVEHFRQAFLLAGVHEGLCLCLGKEGRKGREEGKERMM